MCLLNDFDDNYYLFIYNYGTKVSWFDFGLKPSFSTVFMDMPRSMALRLVLAQFIDLPRSLA